MAPPHTIWTPAGPRPSASPSLEALDPVDVPAAMARRGLDGVDDDTLVDLAASVIGVPHRSPPSSFELHAGLEVLARRALLRWAPLDARPAIRQRIVEVAAGYQAAGEPVPEVSPLPVDAPGAALGALHEAMDAGDLVAVDRASAAVARHVDRRSLGALVDLLATHLGAAGHAPILLQLLVRWTPTSPVAPRLLRPLVHEAARTPTWQLRWVDAEAFDGEGDAEALAAAVAGVPRLGPPGSTSVYPLMHQVDATGVAAAAIAAHVGPGLDATALGAALARVAAWSMLGDDPAHAPYGWTHALTMPAALVDLAPLSTRPTRTLAVAASHLAGFRSGLSTAPVGSASVPEAVAVAGPHDPGRSVGAVAEALADEPRTAAAVVLGAGPGSTSAVASLLAGRAGAHRDAHVAKHALISLDRAAAFPDDAPLHLASVAYLLAWWHEHERPPTSAPR